MFLNVGICLLGLKKKNKLSCPCSHCSFSFDGFAPAEVFECLSSGGFLMMFLVRKQMKASEFSLNHILPRSFIIVSHLLPKMLLVFPRDQGGKRKGGVWDIFGEKPSGHISLSIYSRWMFQAIAFTFVSTDCAVTLAWCWSIMQRDVCVYVRAWRKKTCPFRCNI